MPIVGEIPQVPILVLLAFAQVLLAWAVQRGTALLTTSKTPSRIKENFNISTLPEDAMKEISEGIKTRQRFNAVVETGVPGFIPRGR
jgi:diketogulonate reductase-like aldo/keto reductase